jgi:hypothetical protein
MIKGIIILNDFVERLNWGLGFDGLLEDRLLLLPLVFVSLVKGDRTNSHLSLLIWISNLIGRKRRHQLIGQ